jgi:hypothetical protein
VTKAIGRRDDGAIVHLGEALHHREANAETALRPRERGVDLVKEIEDRGQVLARDAYAGVADLETDLALISAARWRERDADPTARLAVLHRVHDEVREDLLEARRIAVHPHGLVGDERVDAMILR